MRWPYNCLSITLTEFPVCDVVDQECLDESTFRRQQLRVWGNQGLLLFAGQSTREKRAAEQEYAGDVRKVLFRYSAEY